MWATRVFEKDGVLTPDGDRYVVVRGQRRAGKPLKVFVHGCETWCLTCGRVQPDNECGVCEDDGCAGTNVGRTPEHTGLDDGADDAMGELEKIVVWDFPPDHFQAAVATGMCGYADYCQYISVIDAVQEALEYDGHTVERIRIGVDEMLIRLAAMGLGNTPDGRAVVAVMTTRTTNQ